MGGKEFEGGDRELACNISRELLASLGNRNVGQSYRNVI